MRQPRRSNQNILQRKETSRMYASPEESCQDVSWVLHLSWSCRTHQAEFRYMLSVTRFVQVRTKPCTTPFSRNFSTSVTSWVSRVSLSRLRQVRLPFMLKNSL